jgi:hypothetical protein
MQAVPAKNVLAVLWLIIGLICFRIFGATSVVENWILERQFWLRSEVNLSLQPKIAIVVIADKEYNEVFHGSSPLAAIHFQTLTKDIQGELKRNGLKPVLGVDIDTSDQSFWKFADEIAWQDIVWERDVAMREDKKAFLSG